VIITPNVINDAFIILPSFYLFLYPLPSLWTLYGDFSPTHFTASLFLSYANAVQNVDWEAHPAVAILSKTRTGKYIVARQGLPLHDYGEVSVAAANQRRSGLTSGDALPCPLDPSLVEEFENYGRTFKREVFDNTGEIANLNTKII